MTQQTDETVQASLTDVSSRDTSQSGTDDESVSMRTPAPGVPEVPSDEERATLGLEAFGIDERDVSAHDPGRQRLLTREPVSRDAGRDRGASATPDTGVDPDRELFASDDGVTVRDIVRLSGRGVYGMFRYVVTWLRARSVRDGVWFVRECGRGIVPDGSRDDMMVAVFVYAVLGVVLGMLVVGVV